MADLKIVYAPGMRPPPGATADEWLHMIPSWYEECPRCENPPREDMPIYFESKAGKDDQ